MEAVSRPGARSSLLNDLSGGRSRNRAGFRAFGSRPVVIDRRETSPWNILLYPQILLQTPEILDADGFVNPMRGGLFDVLDEPGQRMSRP